MTVSAAAWMEDEEAVSLVHEVQSDSTTTTTTNRRKSSNNIAASTTSNKRTTLLSCVLIGFLILVATLFYSDKVEVGSGEVANVELKESQSNLFQSQILTVVDEMVERTMEEEEEVNQQPPLYVNSSTIATATDIVDAKVDDEELPLLPRLDQNEGAQAVTDSNDGTGTDPAIDTDRITTFTAEVATVVDTTTATTGSATSTTSTPFSKPLPTASGDYIDKDYRILPQTEIDSVYNSIPTGYEVHPDLFSYTYQPRAKPFQTPNDHADLTKTWGSWTLVDDNEKKRPAVVPFEDYPNRDIPRADFPPNSWQTDKEYLAKFLPQSISYIESAMDAILSEYGHGKRDEPDRSFDERAEMFNLTIRTTPPGRRQVNLQGGWTTEFSRDVLVKRVLHAVMTQDTFTIVMGGHSSAAGHGNNFVQSFMMALQRVMEPIMARLGVLFRAHNIGMGGLGTIHNGLASSDMYGRDIDILAWDSSMTEGSMADQDMFYRQAMLGGRRMPALWGGGNTGVMISYHDHLKIDMAEIAFMWQMGNAGVPTSTSHKQVQTLPWAAQYQICDNGFNQCISHRYQSVCWIDERDDNYAPAKNQMDFPGGRAKWHPGDREHLLIGRILAFNLLKPLLNALKIWNEAEDYDIPDEAWHMTGHYQNISQGIKSHSVNQTFCKDVRLPNRVCNLEMNGRSDMYPRVNPRYTSIRSIVKNDLPPPTPNVYKPPDMRHPYIDPPEGEVDVLRIIENGVPFKSELQRVAAVNFLVNDYKHYDRKLGVPIMSNLEPGKGWWHAGISNPDTCDGSYFSFCGRDKENACLMSGHNDDRGGLQFDAYSGWLLMHLENVQNGIIMVKITEQSSPNPMTKGWCSENNVTACPPKEEAEKKPKVEGICDDFKFEFAINGEVTSWDKAEFIRQKFNVQRVVQIWALLDDEKFPKGNVELAIRMTGCGRDNAMLLNHVYWS